MDKAFAILAQLQDGRPHSGAAIAADLGVSRGAVWNHVKRLQAQGVEIFAVPGKGYQLPAGFEFLDKEAIEQALGAPAREALRGIHVARITDSTNQRLLDLAAHDDIHGRAWLAEYQTAGRGRRGDSWLAPPGSGVCLSLGWRFDAPPAALSALSLVVGIAVARGCAAVGAHDVRLKWPNDLIHAGRKLAGILIEVRAEAGGPSTVVIGTGLNCHTSEDTRRRVPQPIAALSDACVATPSRNRLVGELLDALVACLQEFATRGFAPFAHEWRRLDALAGRRVELTLPDRQVVGLAHGVDASGLLLIEHAGRIEHFVSGHVRLAAAG